MEAKHEKTTVKDKNKTYILRIGKGVCFMEPIVGIICEYDPFHRGHAHQFALIQEQLPNASIVCVMSGCFTQRGSPALFSPAFRAQAALRAGASLVLELPSAFAVREAENFALGGVALLNALGCITHLCFGCETDDLALMQSIAAILEQPDETFQAALRTSLCQGQPFVAAQASAIVAALLAQPNQEDHTVAPSPHPMNLTLGTNSSPRRSLNADAVAQFVTKPNNILGICYLRALRRLHSNIQPLPVQRIGEYHASTLASTGFPSASATRKAYLSGDVAAAEDACGYPLTGELAHPPEALDRVLLHRLRNMDATALRTLPGCSEGLENRLAKAAHEANGRKSLIMMLKTRRYAYARLNRLVSHALLGITADMLTQTPLPTYVRLLGLAQGHREMLTLLRQSDIPIIAKAADGNKADPLFALDVRAYDLWALGANLPAGFMYRQPIVVEP